MTQITDTLQEIKSLAEKAAPGPWTYEDDTEGSSMGWIMKDHTVLFAVRGDSAQQSDNAAFIAASRDLIPRLVAALEHEMETNGMALPMAHGRCREDYLLWKEKRHVELAEILKGA